MSLSTSLELAKLASFLFFLLLGLRVRCSVGPSRRRAITLLLVYVITLNGLAGVTQFDNWPFTSNALAVGRPNEQTRMAWAGFFGVDRHGREWQIDPLTWSPVFDSILQYWIRAYYPELSAAEQKEAMHFLLARANAAREALHAGRKIGFERRIGPWNCPYWWRLTRLRHVPPEPYQALRVYELEFTVGAIARDPRDIHRKLLAEFDP